MIATNRLNTDVAINGYHLMSLLGHGGSSSVFKAQQISTGQTVAIKLLHHTNDSDHALSTLRIESFKREIQLCAQIHHPHIVRLLDQGLTNIKKKKPSSSSLKPSLFYAVFEFIPGETLKEFLLKKGALQPIAAVNLMAEVLDALICIHAQGIVHRDLKPQNIMITNTGIRSHVKILDFGIATSIPVRHEDIFLKGLENTETMCSPAYSAPEQLRGEKPTLQTDLYAWGLLFIECLTGKPAIEGNNLTELFHRQLSDEEIIIPTALREHPLGVLLQRVLKKKVDERIAHANTLFEELQRIDFSNNPLNLKPPPSNIEMRDFNLPIDAEITQVYAIGQFGSKSVRSKLSVLCCTLNVKAITRNAFKQDVQEIIQRNQLSVCTDIATHFGGQLAGSLGNNLMFYYNYNTELTEAANIDSGTVYATRTAFALLTQMTSNDKLVIQQGYTLEIRIGIHTDYAWTQAAFLPTGIIPNIAILLTRLASSGEILVSSNVHNPHKKTNKIKMRTRTIEENGELLHYYPLLYK